MLSLQDKYVYTEISSCAKYMIKKYHNIAFFISDLEVTVSLADISGPRADMKKVHVLISI